MPSSIPNELLEAALLVTMDVLFVILDSVALHEFFLVRDAEFKLIKCLSKDTLLRNLERLAWILRKPGLAVKFASASFSRFGPLHSVIVIA